MLDYIRLATPIFSNYTETIFLGVVFLLVIYIILGQFRKTKKILSTIILFISSIFVITLLWIAFCAPHYFIDANDSLFRDGKVSDVGNAIGNLMDPFIAIAAAILTFMAFWVQYNANQKMVENDERLQTERQFYEMLKIHRESVQNLEWKILESPIEYDFLKMANGNYAKTRPYVIKKLDHISYKGLHVLHKYHNELMIAYETILWWYENKQLKQKNVLDFVKKHLNYIQNRNDKKAYIVANIENLNLIAQKNDELEKKYKMKIELIEDECANNLDLWIYDEKKIDITNIPVIKELFYKAYEIFFEGLYNVEIEKNLSRILLAVKK